VRANPGAPGHDGRTLFEQLQANKDAKVITSARFGWQFSWQF
jgi:hypothetical protein